MVGFRRSGHIYTHTYAHTCIQLDNLGDTHTTHAHSTITYMHVVLVCRDWPIMPIFYPLCYSAQNLCT